MGQRKRGPSRPQVGRARRSSPQSTQTRVLLDPYVYTRGRELNDSGQLNHERTQAARKVCLTVTEPQRLDLSVPKKEAKQLVDIMTDKYDIEDEYAKEALTTAVEVMRVPGETREHGNSNGVRLHKIQANL